MADVAAVFRGQAEAEGIELKVASPAGDQPVTTRADVGRMQQVLANLIGNGLRHTGRGGTIVLRPEHTQESVRIQVEDTGDGISPQDLPFVFDRFWRGDRSSSHDASAGGGLGLAIARQLVHAHGGQIQVRSEVGKGTTFIVELPDDVEEKT